MSSPTEDAENKQIKVGKVRESYHHGDLRANLVEATRQLVETHGPDRFSVSDACRAAGVSTAAPYRHFADREEMLLAVAVAGMDRFKAVMAEATVGHRRGSLDALTALGQAYVDFALREPGVFRQIFGLKQRDLGHAEMEAKGMAVYQMLLEQIAAYLGEPEVNDKVRARAFPLWTHVHGLCFLLIDEKTSKVGLEIDREAILRTTAERLLRH
ncbi:MAG: TetR/AcrR family transcriptional regulator [Pseudomonadota bacterium]